MNQEYIAALTKSLELNFNVIKPELKKTLIQEIIHRVEMINVPVSIDLLNEWVKTQNVNFRNCSASTLITSFVKYFIEDKFIPETINTSELIEHLKQDNFTFTCEDEIVELIVIEELLNEIMPHEELLQLNRLTIAYAKQRGLKCFQYVNECLTRAKTVRKYGITPKLIDYSFNHHKNDWDELAKLLNWEVKNGDSERDSQD